MNPEAQYNALLCHLRTGRSVSDKRVQEKGPTKTGSSPSKQQTKDTTTHDQSWDLETTQPTPSSEVSSTMPSVAECLSCTDGSGNTLLHIATKRNNVDDVRLLLTKYADRTCKNHLGRTPLHLASASKCIENVQMLLGKDNCSVSAEDNDGMTPLHNACQSGHTKIAGLLLDRGADIDHKNAEGSTPLNIAIREKCDEIIKQLHSKGASFLVAFNNIKTQEEVITMTETFSDDAVINAVKNTVSEAAVVGEHKSLKFLRILANHTGTKYLAGPVDSDHNTPLHLAAMHGHLEIVKILLETKPKKGGLISRLRGSQDTRIQVDAKNRHCETPLHLAARKGHLQSKLQKLPQSADSLWLCDSFHLSVVQQLIGHNPQLMLCKDSEGRTPLHNACLCGQTKVVGIHIQNLKSVTNNNLLEMTDANGNTPLHIACVGRNITVVKLLVDHGASITARNSNGETPVHTAAQHKSVEIIKLLLNKGDSRAIEVKDDQRCTPLHHAARNNQSEMITFLHQRGANIYAEDKTLCTPVLTAAAHNKVEAFHCLMKLMDLKDDQKNPIFKVPRVKNHQAEILKFLIADSKWGSILIKSTDSHKNSVLHVAASENSLSAVTVLMEKKVESHIKNVAEKTPMHLAAEKGHHRIVQKLLDSNPSLIKEVDNEGKNPLHLACQGGHLMVVESILESQQYSEGVLEAGDKMGNTPLHLACMGGKRSIVEKLIMKGANPKATNADMRTPLHLAAKHNQVDVIEYLFNNVEEPLNHQITKEMPRDIWRMTPLHIACQEGYHKVVMVLEHHLSAEDIRAKDMEENTALHLACEGGKKNIVQLLLDKGELNNVKNARGEAPIHLAARDGYKDIVELLMEEDGIVCTLQDNRGFTPLHHAARNNQEKVIEFLCERNPELINLEDSNSHTPILTAAARLKVKAFQCLMKYHEHCKENPVFKALESKDNPVAILKLMIEDSKWGSKLRRATDSAGNTPLHVAAKRGNLAAVKVLLEVDFFVSEVNLVNKSGETPMHMAAERGHIHIVNELINYQPITKESKDEGKNTPLHLACKNGHLEVAKMLLAPCVLFEKNKEGNTPLHLACMRKGNIGIVKVLIAAVDSDVKGLLNERNIGNQTPLDLAYQDENSDVSIVLHLIGQGANAALKPVFKGKSEIHRRFNFLDWAIERKHRDIAMKVVESDYWKEALRSCHVVEGSPPADNQHTHTTIKPQDSPAVEPDGPPAVKPEGPPAVLMECFPPAIKPEGPPVVKPNGPPAVLMECFPPAIKPEGPPAVKPNGPPAVLLECFPPAIKPNGPPAVLLECFPPAIKPEGPPAVKPNGPPAVLLECSPSAVLQECFPPAIKPDGPPVVKPNGPPAVEPDGPPAVEPDGPPAVKPDGPLAVEPDGPAVLPDGSPAVLPDGPPAVLPDGPPAVLPEVSLSVVNTEGHFTETTPMRELIKEMPDVAEKVFDRCTETKKYVYEFLEDFKLLSLTCCQGRKDDDIESRLQNENDHWGPKNFERFNHPLAIMVKHRRSELLKHELVSTFLRQKSKFGAAFYLADLFLYVLFLLFLTLFALIVPTPLDKICATNSSDHPSNVTTQSLCPDWRQYSSTYIFATLTIIFATIGLMLQFWKFCMLMIRYCSRLKGCKWHNNWKEFLSRSFYGTVRFLMFAFAVAFAAVFSFQCPCVTNTQWQVGVLAVFLGWINMITYIKLVPRLGVYLLMFQNVIYSFFKMLLLGLLLIVAFGLAFYMLFRTPSQMRTAFATPGRALIKTMTADLDFDEMFHLSDDEDEIAYVGASYVMWIVFVIILAILFQNLLTSVAVGDIQEIRQNALLRQRELHVELLLNLEELFPQTLGDIDEQRSAHKTYRIFEWLWELASGASKVEQVHPLEHKLEQALSEIDSIKQILRDHSRKLEETESTVKQVEGHHEVHENLAQRTSEKLDIMKEQFLERFEALSRKFQQSSAAAH